MGIEQAGAEGAVGTYANRGTDVRLGLAYLVRDFRHLSLSFLSKSLAFIAMRYDMSHPGPQAFIATR